MSIASLDFANPPKNDAEEIGSVFGLDNDLDVPAASAPESAPEGGNEGSSPAVVAPAAGGEPTTTPAATPTPAPAQGTETPATPPASPEPPAAPLPALADTTAPAVPAAPDAQALELASLRAQVEALTAAASQPQAQQPGTAPTPNAEPADAAPAYSLSIPKELAEAIFSEDGNTSKAGMTHLVNSLAQHIHQTVRAEFRQELAQRDARTTSADTAASESAAIQAMQDEYYGTFPAHNTPLVKTIVQAEALKLGTEYPTLPWGPDYKAALGARVEASLAQLRGQAAPAAPVAAPTVPAAPAPFAPTTPSRSAIPAFEANGGQADVISDTFAPD